MANLTGIVQELKKQRDRAEAEVKRLDAALGALGSLTGRGVGRKRSRMSVASRKHIAAAQRARWAKWKKQHKKA